MDTSPLSKKLKKMTESETFKEKYAYWSAMLTIGLNIYERRGEKGITQFALAKRVKTHDYIITHLESGWYGPEKGPGLRLLTDIAFALDTTLLELLTPKEKKTTFEKDRGWYES